MNDYVYRTLVSVTEKKTLSPYIVSQE